MEIKSRHAAHKQSVPWTMTETADDFDEEHRTVFHRMSLDSIPRRRRQQPQEYEQQQQKQHQLPSYSLSFLSRRTITKTIPVPVLNALDGATSSSVAILFTLLLMALVHYRGTYVTITVTMMLTLLLTLTLTLTIQAMVNLTPFTNHWHYW